MAQVDQLLKALNSAHWEMSEGFKGLSDANVWKRPAPRLLSVGELAVHVAYWEAQSFFGDGFESALTSGASRYYTSSVDEPFELAMGAEELFAEVKRIHDACVASFQANPHDSEEPNPYREGWTWGYVLEYQAFHIAYHAAQIYTVRHLLGDETPDN